MIKTADRIFYVGIPSVISVCHDQTLRIYHDGLSPHSGYNESVSRRTIPGTGGLFQVTTDKRKEESTMEDTLYYRDLAPHSVSKLYYMAETEQVFSVYQNVFGDLAMDIDNVKRGIVTWPAWSVSARIDTWNYWRTVAQAISCHRSQAPAYHVLEQLSEEQRKMLWGTQSYYRAFSLVNGGRKVETDLFEGLR